jgi:outer membrane protein assembly factor BamA
MKLLKQIYLFLMALTGLVVTSCSVSKFIPEGEYLLDDVKIVSDNKLVKPSTVSPYLRQNPNNRWFSTVKVPLYIYSLSGRDTTRWGNRVVRKIGDAPVLYNREAAQLSCADMRAALQNLGYMSAYVETKEEVNKKKLTLTYLLHTGPLYTVRNVKYDFRDDAIARLLSDYPFTLRQGMDFNVNELNNERLRVTNYLQQHGYYKFNKDFITYTADTTRNVTAIDLTFHLHPYRSNTAKETTHPIYTIRNVRVALDSVDNAPFLRASVLRDNIHMHGGEVYDESKLQQTQRSLARLHAIKFSDIRLSEVASDSLDCLVQLAANKPRSISAELEGTNTSGDLGAAASVSFQNKNLFRGSELFTFKLRGAYEAVTGLQGYSGENYVEYGAEAGLSFPRFMFPFLSREVKRRVAATSELSLRFNAQKRPEFSRRVASVTWGYKWESRDKKSQHTVDLVNFDYVYMPWISPTFKKNYLDSLGNQNPILKYNYENLLIMKTGYSVSYHSAGSNLQNTLRNSYSVRFNIETAGNLLYGLSELLKSSKNDDGQYKVGNIAFAQYVKGDVDYVKSFRLDTRNSIVFHTALGIAYPYANSTVLPFEKRYFSGGANSVRGWSVRRLGPGSFRSTDKNIDFINQSGDIKLDANVEYRTHLFWKLNGALFVDAGNIWTIRAYDEQPGGEFRFDKFYKQIAVAYGLGFRFDFDYFILRFDGGMKALNPVYESGRDRYPVMHPQFSRDFAFHFAVGYPF